MPPERFKGSEMMMKTIVWLGRSLGIGIVIGSLLSGCWAMKERSGLMLDISQDTMIVLKKKNWQGSIWGIDLRIRGDFTDTVRVSFFMYDKAYHQMLLFGAADSSFHGDWYSDSIQVRFDRIRVPLRSVSIDYQFFN